MTPLVRVKDLRKTYSTHRAAMPVLRHVSLEVQRGEALAIMGKSGEGKTTLLHILGTLESPSQGEVWFDEQPLSDCHLPTLRKQHIGFIFQSFHLIEDESVLDNLLLPARIARKRTHKGSASHLRALQLLESVSLASKAPLLAKHLSGGEKQRLGIARALCNDPDLLLADEPTGNLDYSHSQEIHRLLLQCTKGQGKTLVVATHDPALANLCDRVLILKDGHLSPVPCSI